MIRDKTKRLKIIKESGWLKREFAELHWQLRRSSEKKLLQISTTLDCKPYYEKQEGMLHPK